MSKRTLQRNTNLAASLNRIAASALHLAGILLDPTAGQPTDERIRIVEEDLLDTLADCRSYRRRPLRRNDLV